jgi:PAS domain S-box-containing protein
MSEAALLQRDELFHTVFERAGVGIALLNSRGRFVQVNQALCDFLGCTAEDLLGKEVNSISHPDNTPQPDVLLR